MAQTNLHEKLLRTLPDREREAALEAVDAERFTRAVERGQAERDAAQRAEPLCPAVPNLRFR
jgi:hypothetical protein